MYNKIQDIIKSKKQDIDNNTLIYFTNYFYVLLIKNIIPQDINLEDLIDNALLFANKVEFYNSEHWVYKQNGSDTKGLRDPDSKTIFIREDLEEPLKEMIIYHELHHAVQTNIENNMVGINQESNIGRMIMEAQTQWIAEEIYKTIHAIEYKEKEIPTENLRMQSGGTIVSSLHNYEMYDAMLSKLSILLEVPKDFFVSINFLYKDNKGLNLLEEKYNQVYEKRKLKYTFKDIMFAYDYIYCVDLLAYVENPDKQVVLSGNETETYYEIYPGKGKKISFKLQKKYIDDFDVSTFLALLNNGGDYKSFAKFIIDNHKREIVINYIDSLKNESSPSYNTK